MSEDVYVLKKAIDDELIMQFNDAYQYYPNKLFYALDGTDHADEQQIDDWILALKSGKKIVNPMSPREKVKWLYDDVANDKTTEMYHKQYVLDTLREFIIQVAKEHTDVSDWLKDGDPNA